MLTVVEVKLKQFMTSPSDDWLVGGTGGVHRVAPVVAECQVHSS